MNQFYVNLRANRSDTAHSIIKMFTTVVNITVQAYHIFYWIIQENLYHACTADDGKHCCNSCTSHSKDILQLHYKMCSKSFKNTSISLIQIYLQRATWSFLKAVLSNPLQKKDFKSLFHMRNKMSSFSARLTEEGLEAVPPHASPFIPSNPKVGRTTQEVSCIHLQVTPLQQEVSLYNPIHPILAIYKEKIHTVPKSSQG